MTKIILNNLEKRLATAIAKARHEDCVSKNIATKLISTKADDIETHIIGAESELAACKLLGVYPTDLLDTEIKTVSSGTNMGDIVYKGLNIDVKTTPWQNGCLLSNSKNTNVDVFLFLVGSKGEYECKGAIAADVLYQDSNFGNNNGKFRKPCWFVQQSELHDYKKVLDLAA